MLIGCCMTVAKYANLEPRCFSYLYVDPACMASTSAALPVSSNRATGDRHEQARGGEQAQGNEQSEVEQVRTPLPIRQLIVLCVMRFAEPISFSVVSLVAIACWASGLYTNPAIHTQRYPPL